MATRTKIITSITYTSVQWTPPPFGWHKLNTDGSSIGNLGKAGGDAIIRDHSGGWISGCYRHMGTSTNMVAELWALRDGLLMAKDMLIDSLIVEVDAMAVLNAIKSSNTSNSLLKHLISDCRILSTDFRRIKMQHCFREANQSAEALARLGSSFSYDPSNRNLHFNSNSMYFRCINIPDAILLFVNRDKSGHVTLRARDNF